ncbi:MAG: TLD-domain-containing protein, partial [Olpidium bornovanus]
HAFSTAIVENGATLILVREGGEEHVFGGFADEDWKPKPHFYGSSSDFLLSVTPRLRIFRATSYNSNYRYFTFGQSTLRNGLQFGGQETYPGVWIDADFEHGSSRPCTTYGTTAPLSRFEDFQVGEVEAWCLCPPERDEDAEAGKLAKKSVLDTHGDAVYMLEAGGRRMYSKEVRGEFRRGNK